jgi:hypothetical protein
MDQIGSKLSFPKFHMIHRDSSITEGLFAGFRPGSDLDGGEAKAQNTVETVYNQLSTMIGESDPSIIVIRFQEQRIHAKELLVQEDTAKSAVRKAKLRKRFLVDKLSQLQYSGGLKREKLNTKFGIIFADMLNTTSERDKLDKWLHDHFSVMEQMQTKLNEIFKLNDIRPPPRRPSSAIISAVAFSTTNTATTIPAENVLNLLKFLLKYLDKLLGAPDGPYYLSPALLSPATPSLSQQQPATIEGDNNNLGSEFDFGNQLGESNSTLFGLPSPAGSTSASFRFTRGSIAGLDTGGGMMMGDGSELTTHFDQDAGGMLSDRDRAPSIVIPDGNLMMTMGQPGMIMEDLLLGNVIAAGSSSKREDSAGMKVKGLRRGESSEEEEAVTRNFVKRQSQILFEAKTRKGRFNNAMTMNVRNRKY